MSAPSITVYHRKTDRMMSFHLRYSRFGDRLNIVRYSTGGIVPWYKIAKEYPRTIFYGVNDGETRRRFDLLRRQLRNHRDYRIL